MILPNELQEAFKAFMVDTRGVEWMDSPFKNEVVRGVFQGRVLIIREGTKGFFEVFFGDDHFLTALEQEFYATIALEAKNDG